MVSDRSPVVRRRVHRKARSERPVHTDDEHVVTGAAVPPLFDLAPHEVFHLVQMRERVHDALAALVPLDDPVE